MPDKPLNALLQKSEHKRRAHSEGNNVMSWLGFKHVMYMAEEAVLDHFRDAGMSYQTLMEEMGLTISVVQSEGRILHAVKLDDEVSICLTPKISENSQILQFDVAMFFERAHKEVKAFSGKIGVVLRVDDSFTFSRELDPPAQLAAITVERFSDAKHGKSVSALTASRGVLNWCFTVPYFYCHANRRLKMSGYLRLMEEADARFCEQQGIGVDKLLREKRWIPAVPNAKMRILEDVEMNEEINIEYSVIDVIKERIYKSQFIVRRADGQSNRIVAIGDISHAYAEITSRRDWSMVRFDHDVLKALDG